MSENDIDPPKHPGGRPSYEPNEEHRRLVNVMAAGGFQQTAISYALGIDVKTFLKYYREEWESGGAKAHAMVVANLFKQATKDDPRAAGPAQFWSKTRLGWKENSQMELTGPDGAPIQHAVQVLFVGLDDDDDEQTAN
jgi:hypothetical protein